MNTYNLAKGDLAVVVSGLVLDHFITMFDARTVLLNYNNLQGEVVEIHKTLTTYCYVKYIKDDRQWILNLPYIALEPAFTK